MIPSKANIITEPVTMCALDTINSEEYHVQSDAVAITPGSYTAVLKQQQIDLKESKMSLPLTHFLLRTWSSNQIVLFYRRTWCDQVRSYIHHNVTKEFDEHDFSFENGHD